MIGLERVLHAQQKPQCQNSEHAPPARLSHGAFAPTPGNSGTGTSHGFESRHNLPGEKNSERRSQPALSDTVRNGFVCEPGTWIKGKDGRMHICQQRHLAK
jgi:hypothetical protein